MILLLQFPPHRLATQKLAKSLTHWKLNWLCSLCVLPSQKKIIELSFSFELEQINTVCPPCKYLSFFFLFEPPQFWLPRKPRVFCSKKILNIYFLQNLYSLDQFCQCFLGWMSSDPGFWLRCVQPVSHTCSRATSVFRLMTDTIDAV